MPSNVPASRILLVDDDDANRMAIAAMLRRGDHDVREASDGEEALALLKTWQPDVIVLDLMMPWMGGRGFRDAQKKTPFGDVPVVVISGVADVAAQAEAMGAVAGLRKPVRMGDLLAAVDDARRGDGFDPAP